MAPSLKAALMCIKQEEAGGCMRAEELYSNWVRCARTTPPARYDGDVVSLHVGVGVDVDVVCRRRSGARAVRQRGRRRVGGKAPRPARRRAVPPKLLPPMLPLQLARLMLRVRLPLLQTLRRCLPRRARLLRHSGLCSVRLRCGRRVAPPARIRATASGVTPPRRVQPRSMQSVVDGQCCRNSPRRPRRRRRVRPRAAFAFVHERSAAAAAAAAARSRGAGSGPGIAAVPLLLPPPRP
mmetsp:Transcript_37942/g.112342  ORF Transcript_37942/g.112342 Transcript_37942/m.112342 type:complete len:238 (-) Transcript_37942:346-1059(-)|eukprot:350015-Chlamydomonas_euryale.AAC.11